MLDAISAESLKLRRHRATWGLVWILPIGVALFLTLAIVIQLAQGRVGAAGTAAGWIENATDFWDLPRGGWGAI